MTSVRTARGAALAVAAVWPFVVPDPALHRFAVSVLSVALVALSLTVAFGWLRAVTLFQPAAGAAGAYAAASLLARNQALPFAVVAAAAAGSAVALLALLPVLRSPRAALPATSFLLTAAAALVVLPHVRVTPFPRPVFLGVDFAGDRALYLLGLVIVAWLYRYVERLRGSSPGRRMAVLGAAPDLALRSGIRPRVVWLEGVGLAGALAGVAGCLFALQQQGLPPPTSFAPVLAVAYLALPLLAGGGSPAAALAAAVLVAVVDRFATAVLKLDPFTVYAALVALAPLLLGGGLAGAARRRLGREAGGTA